MSSVTIQSTVTKVANYQRDAPLYLAIFSSKDYITLAGNPVMAGDPNVQSSFYKRALCTVDGSGNVTIPDIVVESTEDSSDPQNTLFAHFLNDKLRPVQPFLFPFRVPYTPVLTTWQALMENLALTPILLPPDVTRTPGRIAEFHATQVLKDSPAWNNGAGIAVDGGIVASGTISTPVSFETDGAMVCETAQVNENVDVGGDVNADGDVNAGGDIHGTNIYGNISTATGVPSDEFVGNTWTSTGSLGVDFDSDANGTGEFTFSRGGVIQGRVNNNGTITWTKTINAPLQDNGGMRFSAKGGSSPALGDGSTDDTTAIVARVASIALLGGGILFFPNGNYIISDEIKLPAGIIVEGTGAASTGLGGSEHCKITQTATNKAVFLIPGNRTGIQIRDICLKATTWTGTTGIKFYGKTEPDELDPDAGPTSTIRLENLLIKGFYKAVSCATDGAGEHQCDQVLAENIRIAECGYGFWFNNQNADIWTLHNVSIGARYGVYMNKVGFITLDHVIGVNTSPDPGGLAEESAAFGSGSVFLTYGPANDGIKLHWCQAENYTQAIMTQDTAIGNLGQGTIIEGEGFSAPLIFRFTHRVEIHGTSLGTNVVQCTRPMFLFSFNNPDDCFDSSAVPAIRAKFGMANSFVASDFYVRRSASGQTHFGVGDSMAGVVPTGITPGPVLGMSGAGVEQPAFVMRRYGSDVGYSDAIYALKLAQSGNLLLQYHATDLTSPTNIFNITPDGELLHGPSGSGGGGSIGRSDTKWNHIYVVNSHVGDQVYCDRETNEPLFVVNEDRCGLYFNLAEVVDGEVRAGKRLGSFDAEGNFHIAGRVVSHAPRWYQRVWARIRGVVER